MIERNIACVNRIIATLRIAMTVPRELLPPTSLSSRDNMRYNERDDRSLDGCFVRLAFEEVRFATIDWDSNF